MLVTVCMLVYQQETVVSQAIESVLCQKTDFEYEIIIGDDCSKDGTREILRRYAQMYPGRIQLIEQPSNVGPVRNAYDVLRRAKGEYLAFLEGDDFWTDDTKLQKQIDYLRENPECSMVYHACDVIGPDGNRIRTLRQKKQIQTLSDLYPTGNIHMATSSIVGHNLFARDPAYFQLFGYTHYVGDIIIKAAYLKEGKIGYIDEILSCYRKVVSGGTNYSSIDKNIQRMDAFRAYRAVSRLYAYENIDGVVRFQMQVLGDVFDAYRQQKQWLQCLRIFFCELTGFERRKYISLWLLKKKEGQ